MNPTWHKRGNGLTGPPLPLAGSGDPASLDRTATLLAGDQPGSQGRIRVWSPSRTRLWQNLGSHGFLLAGGVAALLSACIAGSGLMVFLMVCCLPVILWLLFRTVVSLRHPCYIAADDAGISVTARQGSCSLLWTEMRGVERVSGELMFRVRRPLPGSPTARVPVDLSGYPESVEDELISLCCRNARLHQQASDASLFLRRGAERDSIGPVKAPRQG